ncbi:MAG: EpsI family protein [Thermoguttaceae bacterium]|nr:EpsI family protein [Thermoguttaceae bacterium]
MVTRWWLRIGNGLVKLGLPARLFLAAALLVAATALAKISQRPGIDEPAYVPVETLAALPMDLGGWRGEPSQIADVLNQTLDAKFATDRVYSGPAGQVVYLHMAAFDHFRNPGHHHPRVCYGGAGWQPVNSQVLQIPDAGGDSQSAICEFITFANKTEQIYVLYWYQVADRTTIRPEGVRSLWWKVRNRRPLPPQVKVLMQASAASEEAARAAVLELARPVYQWVKQACNW